MGTITTNELRKPLAYIIVEGEKQTYKSWLPLEVSSGDNPECSKSETSLSEVKTVLNKIDFVGSIVCESMPHGSDISTYHIAQYQLRPRKKIWFVSCNGLKKG